MDTCSWSVWGNFDENNYNFEVLKGFCVIFVNNWILKEKNGFFSKFLELNSLCINHGHL